MANPTVTVTPTSGVAGTVVTVHTVFDVPQPPPTPITVTVTTPGGSGTATFNLIGAVEGEATTTAPARALTLVSNDGTVKVETFVA